MSLITENIQDYYEEVLAFANKVGKRAQLQDQLDYLDQYAEQNRVKTKCYLFSDWAPYSFSFVMKTVEDGKENIWFNGGLIYHGPHDNGGDGGAPTFSVCLSPTDGWSIHT